MKIFLWMKKFFILEFPESCEKDLTIAPTVVGSRPHFNVPRKQVGDILYEEQAILAKVKEIGEAEAKKRTMLHARPMSVPVGDARLRELALQLYMETASKRQDVQMPSDFAFSNGWLKNFKMNNKIRAYVGHGGKGSVDMVLNGPKFVNITNHLSDYHPSNIYNCDETGLYLRVLLNKALLSHILD
ncbi:hypothetical protein EC991_000421 [Linnemannia zychae]|nr:hypothetical protein EC991_000421 [Linnemannia zychae]